MKRQIFVWISFILLLTAKDAFAQESSDNLVTGNFHDVTFTEFVQKIEKQTGFHFYYDPTQFDSISITISVSEAHFSAVLDQVFSNTDWHYTIDKEKQVFITKGFTLAGDLPYGFFNGKTDSVEITHNSETGNSRYINQAKK